jgi:S-methylmethionine-dependent homocysteine/selenocysteine methylase
LTYADEAAGIDRAAAEASTPVVVSFTVETDGRLPGGQPLREAIEQVDAETHGAADYFMINCAHPTHFAAALEEDGPWIDRIQGVRANASARSHAELDEAEELDEGDPGELARLYLVLAPRLRNLMVVGGCCGTDHRSARRADGSPTCSRVRRCVCHLRRTPTRRSRRVGRPRPFPAAAGSS